MIRQILLVAAVCASIGLVSCSKPSDHSPFIVLDEALPTDSDAIQQAYSASRASMKFESGHTVDSCKAYLRALQSGEVRAVSSERRIEADYQACEALERLSVASKLGSVVTLRKFGLNEIASGLCSQLDLRTFSHSLRPQMFDGGRTLNEVLKIKLDKEAITCAYLNESMNFTLRPVLQFTDDWTGGEYLIVWLTDEILNGSYIDYQSLLVKMNNDGSWQAIDRWPRPL